MGRRKRASDQDWPDGRLAGHKKHTKTSGSVVSAAREQRARIKPPSRTPFTAEEDQKLSELVGTLGASDCSWRVIAKKFARDGKSCRARWHCYLDPSVRRDEVGMVEQAFVAEAAKAWQTGQGTFRWAMIANFMRNRNDMHIKNKWNSRISRRVKNDEVWQPNPKDLQAEDAQDYAHIVNGLTEYLSKHEIHLGPTEPAGSIRVLVQKVAEVLRDNDSGQPRSRAHCSRKQMAHSSGSFSAASPALSTCTDRRGSPAIGGPGSCNALYNMHDGAAALGIPKYFGQHEVTLGGSESCQLSPGPFGIPALLEGPADLFLTHNIPHSLSSDILQIQSVLEVPQQASALQPRDSIGGYPPESSLPGHGGSHPHVDGYWSSCSMLQQFPATDLKPLQTHTANSLPAPWSEPGAFGQGAGVEACSYSNQQQQALSHCFKATFRAEDNRPGYSTSGGMLDCYCSWDEIEDLTGAS